MSRTIHALRLQHLRRAMAENSIDAYIVLSADPHLSEYLPEYWQARAWLTGFEGSAGTFVVTADFAGLWTDSRYWEQAGHYLAGSPVSLMRDGAADVPGYIEWLADRLGPGACVGADGLTVSIKMHRHWQKSLGSKIHLRLDCDLISAIWSDRPPLPSAAIFELQKPFACRSRADNLAQIRQSMRACDADWHLVSALDDIAWTLNLRGSDVSYNPVFLAHLLIGPDNAVLFVDNHKLSPAIQAALARDAITVQPYHGVADVLAGLPAGNRLLLDPARITAGIVGSAQSLQLIEALNPAYRAKSQKNANELDNIRHTMERDGAALCQFFAWFDDAMARGEQLTELLIDKKITEARARQKHFVSPSFSTIAAFNAHGAMPHYQATPASSAVIEGNGLLLIDSGGQYLGGTTDITRMVPVGQLTADQMRDCTDVLKGMIALSRAVFPVGLPAPQLDVLARSALWAAGADYGHGTGHGVGYFLNVHEGPQTISWRAAGNPDTAMLPGMVTSNEPGLYRPGKWGVRIENLVANRLARSTEFGEFLAFETLTLCPIDTRCIEIARLSKAERDWLNHYHSEVRDRLQPLVEGRARSWLLARTAAV